MIDLHQQETFIKNTTDIYNIYAILAKYYEGVDQAKINLLEEVFHSEWLMKDTDNPDAMLLNIEDKATFIDRVANHGPYQDYATDRAIVNISIAYDTLAFVQVNKNPSRNATCFSLFKINNEWKIMDKIWVNPIGTAMEVVSSKSYFEEIEKLVANYYKAISNTNANTLNEILHDAWEVKYLSENSTLQIESKKDFINRILKSEQKAKFGDFKLLIHINIFHDRLAIVRVDQPDISKTTFFIIFKVAEIWKIGAERWSTAII